MQQARPTRIEKYSDTEMLLAWADQSEFAVTFVDLRFQCPCASCVDENTGKRTLLRSEVAPDVHPLGVSLVGRYAVQVQWSDRHSTGMYHFDSLYEICRKLGRRLA